MLISRLCPSIFFSLPTQEFFRGQGKIKVGTGTEKMKPYFFNNGKNFHPKTHARARSEADYYKVFP